MAPRRCNPRGYVPMELNAAFDAVLTGLDS
jgi:hypothetical protein